MKNFFAAFIGTLSAFFVLISGGAILLIFFIAAMISATQQTAHVSVSDGDSYLVFNLSVNMKDTPAMFQNSSAWNRLMGRGDELQVRAIVDALERASRDDSIKGLFITGGLAPEGYGSGLGALSEVRGALLKFKESGKPIVAYMNYARAGEYYLSSVATELVMDPYGMLMIPGLASEVTFYGGAFERFGVGVQVTRSGDYKSFAEPFVRKDFSPENRQQLQKLLSDLWDSMIKPIAKDLELSPEYLQQISKTHGMIDAEEAVRLGLVGRIAYNDELVAKLKKETGAGRDSETFSQISMEEYIAADGSSSWRMGERVAVVYVEGAIVDGEGLNTDEVGGRRFARAIRKLREDKNVKAIVLRVNSPGGSASASEHIQRELLLAKRDKPVVVSMGSYAASGGYWVSAYGNRIFSEEMTITGSIGVIGMQFDVKQLANNWGITWDTVKTGDYADMFTITRAKTEAEMAIFQNMVDRTYDDFLRKVAEGRNMDVEKVRAIAGGRVWSGKEAVKLGLVDEIGGLNDAINYARKISDTKSNIIEEYPGALTFGEWMNELVRPNMVSAQMKKGGVFEEVVEKFKTEIKIMEQFDDPAGIYIRMPADLMVQ